MSINALKGKCIGCSDQKRKTIRIKPKNIAYVTLIEYDHMKRLKRKDGGQNKACIAKLLISKKNLLQKIIH